jgi:hypothetical protein
LNFLSSDLDAATQTFGKRLACNLTNARKFEEGREDCAAIVVARQKKGKG